MPTGGAGKPRNTRSYSGMGRFPNNVDAMRKTAGVTFKNLVVPIAKGGIGISGKAYMEIISGQRPLNDTIAARLATIFRCKIEDLAWTGTPKVPPAKPGRTKHSRSRALVPYQEPPVPAKRGRPRKSVPIEVPRTSEPVELTIAVGGKLIGGVTMFDTKAMRRVIRDAFGVDDGE